MQPSAPQPNTRSVVKTPAGVRVTTLLPTHAEPNDVVPYTLPSLAWMSAVPGVQPSMLQSKSCEVVRTPPSVSLNTVPPPNVPPDSVVPYRSPSLAWMRPALGEHPSVLQSKT